VLSAANAPWPPRFPAAPICLMPLPIMLVHVLASQHVRPGWRVSYIAWTGHLSAAAAALSRPSRWRRAGKPMGRGGGIIIADSESRQAGQPELRGVLEMRLL
jgi:hypothetical protein